jgi:hypothetical protein
LCGIVMRMPKRRKYARILDSFQLRFPRNNYDVL